MRPLLADGAVADIGATDSDRLMGRGRIPKVTIKNGAGERARPPAYGLRRAKPIRQATIHGLRHAADSIILARSAITLSSERGLEQRSRRQACAAFARVAALSPQRRFMKAQADICVGGSSTARVDDRLSVVATRYQIHCNQDRRSAGRLSVT